MQNMTTFEELAASRRQWIETVLRPWCQTAALVELQKAALEWHDVAGRVDPEHTLWLWAWGRFPALVVEGLNGVEETFEVRVTLRDGAVVVGFPDSQKSRRGRLVINTAGPDRTRIEAGPFPIDAIATVERL